MNDTESSLLSHCTICPRACGVNRLEGEKGFCGASGDRAEIACVMLHKWEEPCISGTDPERGSGAVFFAHCNLKCIYCQNSSISRRTSSSSSLREVSSAGLSEIMLDLQSRGAWNINLVTPTHYMPIIASAVRSAKQSGLTVPVVYNTSSYESIPSLKYLEGIVDVYLADYKYFTSGPARDYSSAPDYVAAADAALAEMFRQTGPCGFDSAGMLRKGVIVRHLVLPSRVYAARKIFGKLYKTYGDNIIYSMMNQYTPMNNPGLDAYPELLRAVSAEEYSEVVDFCAGIAPKYCYIQEGGTVSESFIPV